MKKFSRAFFLYVGWRPFAPIDQQKDYTKTFLDELYETGMNYEEKEKRKLALGNNASHKKRLMLVIKRRANRRRRTVKLNVCTHIELRWSANIISIKAFSL